MGMRRSDWAVVIGFMAGLAGGRPAAVAQGPDFEDLNRAVRTAPSDPARVKELFKTGLARVQALLAAEKPDEALAVLARLDEVRAGNPVVLYWKGRTLQAMGQWQPSMEALRQSRRASDAQGKSRPAIDLALASGYRATGDAGGELAALLDYQGHGGKIDKGFYLALADAYVRTNQKDRASSTLREAVTQFPTDRELLGIVAGQCGAALDHDCVIKTVRAYQKAGGELDVDCYLRLFDAYHKSHQQDLALEVLREAMSRFPADPKIMQLAEAYRVVLKQGEAEASMAAKGTAHFTVRFETMAEDSGLRDEAQRILEASYDRVTGDLRHSPAKSIPVVIYGSKESYQSNTEIAGWAKAHYNSGDGAIRIPVEGRRLNEKDLMSTASHELTHLVLDELSNHTVPSWLTEGLAQIEQDVDPDRQDSYLRRHLRHPRVPTPSMGMLARSMDASGDVHLSYVISWSMTRYIVEKYGMNSVLSTIDKMAKGSSFEEAFAMDYATLQKEWLVAEKSRLSID